MTNEERKELAELLFPNLKHDRDYYEKKYPERNLPDGAMVTRYGPSPTGYVNLGNLLSAFADMVYANQTNGKFFLRIEDTDQKRLVEGGIDNIVSVLHDFKILPTFVLPRPTICVISLIDCLSFKNNSKTLYCVSSNVSLRISQSIIYFLSLLLNTIF